MDKKSLTQRIGIIVAVIFILGFMSAVAFKLCLKLDRSYGQIEPESLRVVCALGNGIENGESPEVLQSQLINAARKDHNFGDLIIINNHDTIIAAKNPTAIGKTFAIVFVSDSYKGIPVPLPYKQGGHNTHTDPKNLYSFNASLQYMFNDFGEYKNPSNTSYHIIGNYRVEKGVLIERNKLIVCGNVFDKIYHICLFSFWLLLPIWVYLDAKRRQANAAAWGTLILFTSVVGWVVYLIARPQTIICPACALEQSTNAKFCCSCGSAIKNCCPQCGAEINNRWLYCGECGRRLEE